MSLVQKKSTSVLLLALCTLLVYSNIFHHPFLWDDNMLILQNALIQNVRHFPDLFRAEFFTKTLEESDFSDGGYYRPIISLSFMLDYSLWKENPFGYHLTNVLFHLLNVLLVYTVGQRLFGRRRSAFLGALLFAIHPIQTEAVSFIPSRVDLIGVFFYLASWLLFDRWIRFRRRSDLAASLVLFLAALLSKEMTVTLPLFLFCYAFTFVRESRRRALYAALSFWALLTLYFLVRNRYFPLTQEPLWGYLPRLPSALVSSGMLVLSYLRLLVFPHPLHLERSHNLLPGFFEPQALLFPIGVVACAGALWRFRQRKAERFLFVSFFVTLLPVLNIVPIYPSMAEHYLYLPSVGFFLLAAGVAEEKWSSVRTGALRKGMVVAGALLLVAYGARTLWRNRDYADELSLFEKTRRYTPESFLVNSDLGALYLARHRPQEAIPLLEKANRIAPKRAGVLANMGMAYRDLGEYDKAISYYLKAIEAEPSAAFYNSLGVCYGMFGKKEEAEKAFRQAIVLKPGAAEAYYNLGKLYWDQKRWSDVEALWRKGLEKDPNHPLLKEWFEKLKQAKTVGQK